MLPIIRTRLTLVRGKVFQVVVDNPIDWHQIDDCDEYLATDRLKKGGPGDPLARFALYEGPSLERRVFVLSMHHSLFDGISRPHVRCRLPHLPQHQDTTTIDLQQIRPASRTHHARPIIPQLLAHLPRRLSNQPLSTLTLTILYPSSPQLQPTPYHFFSRQLLDHHSIHNHPRRVHSPSLSTDAIQRHNLLRLPRRSQPLPTGYRKPCSPHIHPSPYPYRHRAQYLHPSIPRACSGRVRPNDRS